MVEMFDSPEWKKNHLTYQVAKVYVSVLYNYKVLRYV